MFNGFLLSANLDVLFDSFLVSFSEAGKLLVSKKIVPIDQKNWILVRICVRVGCQRSIALSWRFTDSGFCCRSPNRVEFQSKLG